MQEFESINPATGGQVWKGCEASAKEIRESIHEAEAAFPAWASKPFESRAEILCQYAKVLESRKELIALRISEETGKPLWESKLEVSAMVAKIPISIEAYQHRCAPISYPYEGGSLTAIFRPHGVVAVFGPFNFPGHLPNGHIVPALLAGNAVIFKPSELTPLVGETLKNCFSEAGLPQGLFHVVQGGPKVGSALALSEKIKGIFFTGSARVGEMLESQTHPGRILALEMGGNNPLVVSELRQIKEAAYLTIQSAYLTTGQRCTAARRLILAPGCPKEEFIEELKKQVRSLKIGAYDSADEPFMGPLISLKAANELRQAESLLVEKGAKILINSEQLMPGLPFLSPSLLDVTGVHEREDCEYFGPLLQLIETPSLTAAIQEANNTAYGLSAGLLSESKEEWEQFSHQIRAGIINWNSPLTGASSKLPFGGIGKSGNFRPSALLAADYCSYPIASTEFPHLSLPKSLTPGITL